jgi:hypothetical protein
MGGGSRSGFLLAGEYSACLNNYLTVRALSSEAGVTRLKQVPARGRLALIASARH